MAGPTQLNIPLTTFLLPSFLLRNMDRFHCSARSLEFMFSTSSSLSFSSISWKAFLVRILTMTGLGSALVLSAFSMDKTWWQKWPKEVVTHHNTHTVVLCAKTEQECRLAPAAQAGIERRETSSKVGIQEAEITNNTAATYEVCRIRRSRGVG